MPTPSSAATIALTSASTSYSVGETFTVDVGASQLGLDPLAAWSFELDFDGSVIELAQVEFGIDLGAPGSTIEDCAVVLSSVPIGCSAGGPLDDPSSEAGLAQVSLLATPLLTDPVQMARLTFRALQGAAATDIRAHSILLSDPTGREIAAPSQTVVFSISVPEPTTGFLLLTGLAAFARHRRAAIRPRCSRAVTTGGWT
jgi:hypothetical protein